MSDTVTIYDLEIEEKRYEKIKEKIKKLDNSRNYGKKHIGKKGFQLLEYLLDQEMEDVNTSIDRAERRIQNLKNVVRGKK